MSVISIRATTVGVPLAHPTKIATRILDQRQYLLVEITSDDGHRGVGYTYVGTAGGRTATACLEELLGPVYLGQEEDIEGLWKRAYQETLLTGRRGLVLRVLSALDIALWDLRAVRANVPLAVLLGGSVNAPLPAYASGGYYSPTDDPVAAVAAEIRANRAQGFTDHKIKVGGLSVAQDAERVRAAIGEIAGSGRLALDANNAYQSVPEARRACEVFEAAAGDAGLWWFEEPLSPEAAAGHSALGAQLRTPIATGEIQQTRWEFRPLLEAGGIGYLQVDAGVAGGVTEWRRIAAAAAAFDVPVAPHWHHNLHAHLGAATPNNAVIEHFAIEKSIYNFEELLTEGSRTRFGDGQVHLSDAAGLGIEFDTEVVAKYQLATTTLRSS
ncbi:mandelate racemase/muconate lactonizing enzyme family protein [Amycolatopsis acidicola]|uniref:Mandelate racemase/muconate lactonizing enzyme family protein n=1 Tax=Amycolatopsis acidicola TaxID=2596893 RepID=A0A5N0VFL2_9PSEU|nr:mandelate racemase/muconate lactonizing enzyme family protein [Amycolatopsis acidicola]KAA9164388.1 mandelate racemase/muconate lactonizing enzyme family protein [Amycolatopsis acidicola]